MNAAKACIWHYRKIEQVAKAGYKTSSWETPLHTYTSGALEAMLQQRILGFQVGEKYCLTPSVVHEWK
jgi:hypothetical protein